MASESTILKKNRWHDVIFLLSFVLLLVFILFITNRGALGCRYVDQYIFNEYLGNVNWLIVPSLLIIGLTLKKRERWEIALASVYVIAFLLITIKGYENYRYFLTLIPLTITGVLRIGWQFVEKESRFLKIGVYLCFMIFIVLGGTRHLSNIHEVNKGVFDSRNDDIPWKMFEYIDRLGVNHRNDILVCNAPAFYYYSEKPAITYMGYYRSNAAGLGVVTETGVEDIFRVPRSEEISVSYGFSRLRNQYGVKYILTRSVPGYYKEFSELIKDGSTLVMHDKSYSLYKLNAKYCEPLTPAMLSNVTPRPYQVIYSSRRENSDWDAFRAFDNVREGRYGWLTPVGSKNEYIGFDFGENNHKVINRYSLVSNDESPVFMPRDWVFEGSNDNEHWIGLQEVRNQTEWMANERRDFNVPSRVAYRYYRIYVRSGNDDDYLLIGEFEVWFDKSD